MTGRYWGPIRALGGTAAIGILIALAFPFVRDAVIAEDNRGAVLVQAVPFVAAFIAVLMLYILVIVLAARRLNGRITNRAHSPVALLLIAGIVVGVTALFQPLAMVGYRFGFTLALASTLGYILWSHITPRSPRQDADLPPYARRQHTAGAIAAVIVGVAICAALWSANAPVEPYGVRQRQWDRFDEARKAEIAAEAQRTFTLIDAPFMLFLSLFPAGLAYFAVRELTPAPAPALPPFLAPTSARRT